MQSLESICLLLKEYFESKPIIKAWIFGSYARGEQTPDSDIDILVDFDTDKYPGLLSHAGMIIDIEELLGKKIDLVPNECLYPALRPYVDNDKILIYERN